MMENHTIANVTSLLKDYGVPQWTSNTLISCMIFIALIGIPGNVIVLAVVHKIRDKSSTDYFILSMSFIDLYSAFVNTISYILHYQATLWRFLSSIVFCRLHIFSIGFTNITTTLLLGATAYDRYRRTSSNSIKDTSSASTTAKRVSIGIILSGLSYSSFFIFTTSYEPATRTCSREDSYKMIASIFSVIIALVFLSMFLLVIVCYTRVAIILHRHYKTMSKKKVYTVENKANKNTLVTNNATCSRSTEVAHDLVLENKFSKRCHQSPENRHRAEGETEYLPNNQTVVCDIEITNKDRKHNIAKNMTDITKSCQQNPSDPQSSQQQGTMSDNCASDRRRKMVNRTTLMMFFITLIYVTSWIVNWTVSIYGLVTDSMSLSYVILAEKIFMINCMTNPLFYIMMSSKFRHKAKKLFCNT